jgi:hypothetical protein
VLLEGNLVLLINRWLVLDFQIFHYQRCVLIILVFKERQKKKKKEPPVMVIEENKNQNNLIHG